MNHADWVIVSIVSISGLISLWRGFVREALSLVIWLSALSIALFFSDTLSAYLINLVETPSLRKVATFLILFIATLIVGGLVSYILSALVKMTGLTGTDRLLGMVFGVARGLLLVLALLILVPPIVPINQDAWWQESMLIPQFLLMQDWAINMVNDIKSLIFA
jgi:membrane protein required for colicin V production